MKNSSRQGKIELTESLSRTIPVGPPMKCVFVFAFDPASNCSIKWKFRLIYIDSCQDAKLIIILLKTLVKPLVKPTLEMNL